MALSQKQSKPTGKKIEAARAALLDWYALSQRDVPWRIIGKQKPDPYKIWLSEIMCQQTTVQAVKAYYAKFLNKWPTIIDLANAPEEEVLSAWAGLGYYARARNLHKCAKEVATHYKGIFPADQEALRTLPGIGEYTSAAIAAIAFKKEAVIIDGNVERIMARFFAIEEPLPKSRPLLKTEAEKFYAGTQGQAGALAQAFMDLGATICIPKAPRCPQCPIQNNCAGFKAGIAPSLPNKIKAKARPQKHGYVYWIKNDRGQVLFHKRPSKGLLGGMQALPTSDWIEHSQPLAHAPAFTGYGFNRDQREEGTVRHTFTHFDLELIPVMHRTSKLPEEGGYQWAEPDKVKASLPSVFAKAFALFERLA